MSNETLYQAAVRSAQDSLETREIKRGRVRALLGDVAGNLVGPSGVPWVLARLYGDPSRRVEAYNGTPLTPTFNMAVVLLVRYENGRATRYDVEGLDNGVTYAGGYIPGQNGGVALHAISHERGGGSPIGGWDAVNVYERMFTSLRPDAQVIPDLTVAVAPGYYWITDTEYYFAGGNTGTFTPPGSGSEYHVVTLDAAGALNIQVGALTSPPVVFTLPTDEIPIVAVYLTAGQTAITESDMLDIRPFMSVGGTGGGGTPHDLLDGTIDQDTLAHTVARGDLIVGNSTPKWAALAIGTSAKLLQSNGTDPSWVAVSGDATVAAGGALTLANTAVTPATYGDTTHVAQVTVDSKGRITAASDVAISGASLTVKEVDGTPTVTGVVTIEVSNGTLTDNGGGDVTIATGGGGGSPGGSDKNVQYNNSSAFGGIANNTTATDKFLRQVSTGTPSFEQVTDADLSLSNITTNDVSTSKHGFAPILPNDATKYLDGTGAYTVPAGSSGAMDIIQIQVFS